MSNNLQFARSIQHGARSRSDVVPIVKFGTTVPVNIVLSQEKFITVEQF
jgi:hypothetical protein